MKTVVQSIRDWYLGKPQFCAWESLRMVVDSTSMLPVSRTVTLGVARACHIVNMATELSLVIDGNIKREIFKQNIKRLS